MVGNDGTDKVAFWHILQGLLRWRHLRGQLELRRRQAAAMADLDKMMKQRERPSPRLAAKLFDRLLRFHAAAQQALGIKRCRFRRAYISEQEGRRTMAAPCGGKLKLRDGQWRCQKCGRWEGNV